MSREYFRIPVCVLILVIKDHQIFLIKRFNTGWEDESYTLPGGCVDGNESIKNACIREANEELGIHIDNANLRFIQVAHIKRNDFEYLAFTFSINKWNGECENREIDKHMEGKWFNLDNLPNKLDQYARGIIESYRNPQCYIEYGW